LKEIQKNEDEDPKNLAAREKRECNITHRHCSPIVGGLNPGGVVYGFGISSSNFRPCAANHLTVDSLIESDQIKM